MKKNISIGISGIIFYIEEDGYEKLKEYLDSINRYFSKFDDSAEIVSDIESRIAEIFLARLKDGRQVVNLEDVENLMATMGSIKDFKAVEEPDDLFEDHQTSSSESKTGTGDPFQPKRLYRDTKRKAIGGVAAGMGHYFNIDPLWIRIVFLVFFISFFFEFRISMIIAVIYGILWMIIPGSDDLPYERKFKKMFRNPDDKVLGGVASGVATYFGIDVVIVRLIFVLFIFIAFSGPIAYIILWIILPEARSITDKMEMQGEPVTLSNIEANIKKSLNVKEGEENIIIKILLFPFRLIALLIDGISRNFGPLLKIIVDAIRIIAGVLLTMIGIFSLIGLIISMGAVVGVFASGNFEIFDALPLYVIKQTIPTVIYVAVFTFLFIPFLVIAILGIMVITRKNMLRATVGWSLFAIWIAATIAMSLSIPPVIANYSRDGVREEIELFDMEADTTFLTITPVKTDLFNDFTTLTLKGHDQPEFRLVKRFEAKGKTLDDAFENTKSVYYQVQQNDSILSFDAHLKFEETAAFRMQKVNLTLFIPYNQKFIMDRDLSQILRNTLYSEGYSTYEMTDNLWEFTTEGLNCITCSKVTENTYKNDSWGEPEQDDSNPVESSGSDQQFNFKDFNALQIGSLYSTEVIVGGNNFQVSAIGNKKDLGFLQIEQEGGTLKIFAKKEDLFSKNKVKLVISMPELKQLDLHGGSKTSIKNLKSDQLKLQLSGAAFAEIELQANLVDISMSGSSKLILNGNLKNLETSLSGIAILDAFDCPVDEVNINTSGASNAKLFVKNLLNVKADGGSTVSYQGNPHVSKKSDFASSVKKID